MEKLLLFPFNGNALEALDCLGNEFELIGFVDDTPEKQGQTTCGVPVYDRSALLKFPEAKVLAAPGSPVSFRQRKKILDGLNIPPERFATVIHPKASISAMAKIGYNVLIMAGVVVTSNAVIGNHICILPNSVIHHDATVGNYTLIGSGVTVAGNVDIGENCYIATGSTLINNITIGESVLIGMGSNVLRSLPANATAYGNPAKIRQDHK